MRGSAEPGRRASCEPELETRAEVRPVIIRRAKRITMYAIMKYMMSFMSVIGANTYSFGMLTGRPAFKSAIRFP